MKVPLNDTAPPGDGPEPFEKLELTTGEVARLVIPVDEAECVYVHTMEAPVVSGGKIQMDERKRRDGTKYEVPLTTFVGRRACLGDADELRAHGGVDEKNCPMCLAAVELGITDLIPERRFALPVIRIACTSKTSSDPQDPPGAKIYVFGLTAKQYGELSKNFGAIRELYDWPPEHPVRPNQADIIVECEDGEWKRYKWLPPKRRAWDKRKNPQLAEFIGRLWGNEANRPTDEQLALACARPADRRWVEIDLAKVTSAWAEVRSIERGETPERTRQQPAETAGTHADDEAALAAGLEDLDDNIDEILGTEPGGEAGEPDLSGLEEFAPPKDQEPAGNGHQPQAEETSGLGDDVPEAGPAAGPDDDGELFGDPEPAAAKPAAAKAAAEPAGAKSSFDEIMDGL